MRRRSVLAALAVGAVALVLVTAAGADIVNNNDSEITVVAGGSSVGVGFFITETGGDCNPADGTPAVVTMEAPNEITASPGQLTFDECDTPQTVAFSAPASTDPGTYEVTVNASDDGGGTWTESPGTVTVIVETPPPPPPPPDTTPPTITFPSPVPITAQATSGAGAVVTFSVSGFDNVDGSVRVSCAPGSGSTFPVGDTTVGCTASDAAGNSSEGTFTVRVQDTQPPTLTLPAPINVLATSSAGAVVSFSAFANDTVDGTVPVTCTPGSGSTFPIGGTTVTCSAVDKKGNAAPGSFTVTVADAAPVVSVPPTQRVEATGPRGASVTYLPAPSASDTVDGPLAPSCIPASGATFPLGSTTVTCTAVDRAGSLVAASFQVNVVDTTPPVVSVPPPWTFVGDNGLPRANPSLAVYLSRGRAADLVDPAPALHIEAPEVLPYGRTAVRYVAMDKSGNIATDSTFITVVPPPAPGQPRPPAPPADDPPPGKVTTLRARPGNRVVRVSWTAPRDADVARYAAFRSERSGPQVQVYSGQATSFTDRGLVNGVEYRYVVVAYDRAGNRSVGVAVIATPRLPMLLAPQDGARLARATTFSWRRVAGAGYYNFQLFRVAGTSGAERLVKVLSAWPVTNRFKLRSSWRFAGRSYQLVAGTYRWYVWPGYGARADARYGDPLGERSFVVVRRR
jgi:hypothetical protein